MPEGSSYWYAFLAHHPELINTPIRVNRDKSLPYPQRAVDHMQGVIDTAVAEGFAYPGDDIRYVLGEKIWSATNRGESPATITFGYSDHKDWDGLVELITSQASQNPDQLPSIVEMMIGYALGVMYGMPYGAFQAGVTFSGHGLKYENWQLDIDFSPQQKNIEPLT